MNNTQAIAANLEAVMMKAHRLQQRINNLEQVAKKWQIEFSFEVDSITKTVTVKAAKPYGGKVATFPITFDTLLTYKDSVSTLTSFIADRTYTILIKDSLYEVLNASIEPVIENVNMIVKTQ